MTSRTENSVNPFDLFHPVEHSIIAHWLGVTPPEGCPDFDSLPLDDKPSDHIGLVSPAHGCVKTSPCSNAVARIALRGVEGTLPQWAALYGNGFRVFGREPGRSPVSPNGVALMPRFLFKINWADSAPGFSWPEAYHMTYFPWYDVHVVSASHDCDEIYGYTDIVYGVFPEDSNIDEELEKLFLRNWNDLEIVGYGECWKCFWEAGLISEGTAVEWALQVNWYLGFLDGWRESYVIEEPDETDDEDYL